MDPIWNMILGFVLGMLSSGIVVVLYEYNTQPDLIMNLDTKRTQGFHPNNKKPFEFYHVVVINKPPYFIMPSRKPAWACQARIDVFDEEGTLTIKEVQARWTSQPDPLLPAVAGNSIANLIDPARIVYARKVDVHTNGDQHMPVVLKFEGEEECYIFSNESYPHPMWKNPDWKLPLGEYRVKVTLYYERGPREFNIKLENKGISRDNLNISLNTA